MTPQELRSRRRQLGLTPAELGAAIGVPVDTVYKWERGQVSMRHPLVLRMALTWLAADKRAFGPDVEAWLRHIAEWAAWWMPADPSDD